MLSGITEKSWEETNTSKSITLKLNDSDFNPKNWSAGKSFVSPTERVSINLESSRNFENEEFQIEYADEL